MQSRLSISSTFPPLMLMSKTFMPKQTVEPKLGKWEESKTLFRGTTSFILCFLDVSTSYHRNCTMFILREPTFFFSCMAWSVFDKTLQNVFHQNDVPATEHNFTSPHNKIKDSLKFWDPRSGFRIPAAALQSL